MTQLGRTHPDTSADDLLRALGDHGFEVDHAGICLRRLGPPERLPHEPIPGRPLGESLPEDAAAAVLAALAAIAGGAGPQTVALQLPAPGGPRWFEARLAPTAWKTAMIVIRDIHDRRRAENHLAESESRFELMADYAPVLLWMADRDGECVFFNRTWTDFTGRSLEQELGVGWASGVHFEHFQRCMRIYLDAFVARRSFKMEYLLRRADGEYRWILDQGTPRLDAAGSFEGFIGSCIDITDIREAQTTMHELKAALERRVEERTAALRASVAERELLIREIHHRVKNNLQLISSLLSLQLRHLDGPARELLDESCGRVHAIALLHEKLYQSKDLRELNLRNYLSSLSATIAQTIGGARPVRVTTRGDDVTLPLDAAIPCGLIVNELTTNAFKHAFPDGRAGSVSVVVEALGARQLAVTVSDDGVGLPDGLDFDNPTSLGLDIVAMLTQQLGGELAVEGQGGATFRLSFGYAGVEARG